jgi:predicted GNAT family N-acyltransferase
MPELRGEASLEEVVRIAESNGPGSDIADMLKIRDIYLDFPHNFGVVRRAAHGPVAALLAHLPLNAAGLAAIQAGRFDGRCPDPAWLASPMDEPAAIYLWFLWSPGRLSAGLTLLRQLMNAFPAVAFYSSPIDAKAASMHTRLGLVPLHRAASGARPIVVLVPQQSPTLTIRRPDAAAIRIARSLDDLMRVFAIRSETYMGEQACPFEEEFDGNDLTATHVIAAIGGQDAGCARIRWFGDFAKIERMTVRPRFRRTPVVRELASFVIAHARRKGYRRLYAHSRADLVSLWAKFAFAPIPGREPFCFSGIDFVEVCGVFEPASDAITFGCDPMVANRPEGDWAEPGPQERGTCAWEDMSMVPVLARSRQAVTPVSLAGRR